MPDYREVRHDMVVGDYSAGWKAVVIEPVALDDAVRAIVAAHEDWLNIAAAQFVIHADLSVSWYIRAGTLTETTFFPDFFNHPIVRETLPILGALNLGNGDAAAGGLGFSRESAWWTTARLAGYLTSGPLTGPSGLTDPQVIALIGGFAKSAFREAYSEGLCHHSGARWADWFVGYRNSTSILIDKARGLLTVILITDAD